MRIRFSSLVATAAVALAFTSLPSVAHAQAKSSVCKDGTTSAATGKGACSGHGGVDAAKTKAAAKAAKTDAKPAAKAETKPAATPPAATAAKMAPSTAKKDVATKSSASEKDAAGATAECKDGTYSHAASHSGACSKHGGVAKFLK